MSCDICRAQSHCTGHCTRCGHFGEYCVEHAFESCPKCDFAWTLYAVEDEEQPEKKRLKTSDPIEIEEKEADRQQQKPPSPQQDIQSLINLHAKVESDTNHPLQGFVTTQKCPDTKTAVHWLPDPSKLSPPIEICPMTTVVLGHSFAEMREYEEALRASTGITIKFGWAAKGCPNNALAEVRLLITNNQCEYRQIRIRFCDERGNIMLFRSTGGRIMEYELDDAGGYAYDDKNCRKKSAKVVKATGKSVPEKSFVFVGAYSFCSDKTQAGQEEYRRQHDTEHMSTMKVQGKAGEHFHHSEQGFFRLLFDHPGILKQALDHFQTQDTVFCSKGPIVVHAVCADIFTTRAACDNCKKGSIVVCDLKEHFFEQALAQIDGIFTVASGVMKLVRIDCAVPHNNTPTKATAENTPLVPKGILHALPSAGSIDANGQNVYEINYLMPVNQAVFILQAFTESRELTEIERLLRTSRELGAPIKQRSHIPGELAKTFSYLAKRDPNTFLRLALEMEMKLELTTQQELKPLARAGLTGPGDTQEMRKLRTVVMSGLEAGIPPETILSMIIRNYKDFGMTSPDEAIAKAGKACMYQIRDNGTAKEKFHGVGAYFAEKEEADALTDDVKNEVAMEIKQLVKAGDDDSLQQAAKLAEDFGQQKAYDSAIEEMKKEEEVKTVL